LPPWPSSTPCWPLPPPCFAWCVGEALMRKGKASMLGAASGAVAGLVAITPACGNIGIGGASGYRFAVWLCRPVGCERLEEDAGCRRQPWTCLAYMAFAASSGAILTGVFDSPDLGGTQRGCRLDYGCHDVTPDAYVDWHPGIGPRPRRC
jgi:ammonia channel protein AmtB